MFVSCDFLYKGTKTSFFVREMTLKIKCFWLQFNVFSVKSGGGSLIISLNYWRSCNESRIYYWTVVHMTKILRSARLLSVSPRASHSEAFKSIRKSEDWNKELLFYTERRKQKFTSGAKFAVTHEWKNFIGANLVIEEFHILIFLLDMLAPTGIRQFI